MIKNFIKKYLILPGYAFFRKLPVNNDLIIFESNMGRNYSGNPKHIYEEIVKQGLDKKLKCVWILEDVNTEIPGNTLKIKRSRIKYYYYMARAKIWVFDTRDPPISRKGNNVIIYKHGTALPLKNWG